MFTRGGGRVRLNTKILPVILVFILGIAPARAATDFQCMADCQRGGALYQFCLSRCSFSTAAPMSPRVDFGCMSQCSARGYQYAYCQQACSY